MSWWIEPVERRPSKIEGRRSINTDGDRLPFEVRGDRLGCRS